jgi:hypothetical protein
MKREAEEDWGNPHSFLPCERWGENRPPKGQGVQLNVDTTKSDIHFARKLACVGATVPTSQPWPRLGGFFWTTGAESIIL